MLMYVVAVSTENGLMSKEPAHDGNRGVNQRNRKGHQWGGHAQERG
jgi:hypothetical protein